MKERKNHNRRANSGMVISRRLSVASSISRLWVLCFGFVRKKKTREKLNLLKPIKKQEKTQKKNIKKLKEKLKRKIKNKN